MDNVKSNLESVANQAYYSGAESVLTFGRSGRKLKAGMGLYGNHD